MNMFNSDYANKDNTPSDDIITLKVSKRPAKFYQFIKYEKEKMYDYKYFLSKIQSISKKSYYHILYLKKRTNEELKIVSESDWNDYFFNNIIEEFIDSRKILKIEFELTKQKQSETNPNEKTLEILSHFQSEVFMNKFLGFLNKNDTIQNEFYDYLMKDIQTNNAYKRTIDIKYIKKNSSSSQSPKVRDIMKKKFTEIQNKIILLDKLVNNVDANDLNINDEGLEEEESNENGNGNENAIQPFCSYYDTNKLTSFRSKILNENMPGDNLNISHYNMNNNNNL